jgi:hypothetical protein
MKARYCCLFGQPEMKSYVFDNVTVYGNYKTRYGAIKSIENLEHGEVNRTISGWCVVFDHVIVSNVEAESNTQALYRAKRVLNDLLERELKV